MRALLAAYLPGWLKEWLRPLYYRLTGNEAAIFRCQVERRQREGFFFIQIGANDGVSFDPIHPFIKKYGWRGILVEPLPDYMAQLQATYSGCKGLSFEMSAVTDDPSRSEIVRVDPQAVVAGLVPSWAQGIASLCPEKNALTRSNAGSAMEGAVYDELKRHIVTQKISTITFSALVEKYRVERIDLLQIDTEGHDLNIIRSIDFSRLKPAMIHAEFCNLDAGEQKLLRGMLDRQGYKILYAKKDILAVLKGAEAHG